MTRITTSTRGSRGLLGGTALAALLAACGSANLDPVVARAPADAASREDASGGGEGDTRPTDAALLRADAPPPVVLPPPDAAPPDAAPPDAGQRPPDGAILDDRPDQYLPLAVGNRWTYAVRELNRPVYQKINEVLAMEAVGGTGVSKDLIAFKVATRKLLADKTDLTVTWQAWEGSRLARYREDGYERAGGTATPTMVNLQSVYEPHRIRLDVAPMGKALATLPSWTETYRELVVPPGGNGAPQPCSPGTNCTRTEQWRIVGVDRRITVTLDGRPTELRALVVNKRGGAESDKTYWFVKGIGKVREVGGPTTGQIEELTSVSLR